MNIVINPTKFNSQHIFFLEKKKNNIIDGCFSKVIYSPEHFTMNGIFFVIPFVSKSNTNISSESKYTVYFYTHDVKNLQYITILSQIENSIINTYKEMNGLKKQNNLVLTNQLHKGYFKIYKEKTTCKSPNDKKYMLKISGVWENAEEIGITYKFIEICENIL
jgi:hypothetical protein